jgi:AAA domain/Bifunctional DNA primase/polymerase, N-terminal
MSDPNKAQDVVDDAPPTQPQGLPEAPTLQQVRFEADFLSLVVGEQGVRELCAHFGAESADDLAEADWREFIRLANMSDDDRDEVLGSKRTARPAIAVDLNGNTALTMRDKAVALAKMGFRVFPIGERAKNPCVFPANKRVPPGGNYHDHIPSSDPVDVAAMWTAPDGGSLNYNIGINANDLLVIDIDNKREKAGELGLLKVMRERGLKPEDFVTVEARTPTGGRHLFYRSPEGTTVQNTVSRLAPGVDTRGFHGYVVGPGSVVADGEYQWVRPPDRAAMLMAPASIVAACRLTERTERATAIAEAVELDTDDAIARATQWLEQDAPEAIENAGGDLTTFRVAATVKDMGISEETCFELLADCWNQGKAIPPWSAGELEQKVANAYTYGKQPIGVASAQAQFEPVTLEEKQAETKLRFPLVPYRQLVPSRDVNYLVKGFLPREGVGVLWGPPKCGKSFSWYDIAMHIVMGREYRGRRVTQGTVVYCAFEGAAGYGARTEAFRRHYKIPSDLEIPLYLMPARTNLIKDHPQLITSIRQQLKESTRPAMVVLDTLNRSFVGSESKDEDMTAYYLAADAIRAAFDCFVQIIHHCGLDGSRPRGHSSLTGAVAVQHAQKRRGDDITIEVEFMRDGPEGAKIESRLITMEIGKDIEGDSITSCVTVPKTGFEDISIAPTPLETEWCEKLHAWTEDQRKALGVTEAPFSVKEARKIIFGLTNGVKAVAPRGASRPAIRERLMEMTEKGLLSKVQRGKWVIGMTEIAGNGNH